MGKKQFENLADEVTKRTGRCLGAFEREVMLNHFRVRNSRRKICRTEMDKMYKLQLMVVLL